MFFIDINMFRRMSFAELRGRTYRGRKKVKLVTSLLTVEGLVGQDVGVTGIEDDHGSAAEETTAGSSHLDVVA